MKPIKRQDKINQKERREQERQAKERILERHLREALAQTNITSPIKIDHQPILNEAG